MSEASKAARSAMKAKISRLVRTDPKSRVDASDYTPPDALDADVKTGMRPVSRRQFRRGGKVFANEGIAARPRADKATRPHAGFGAESKAKRAAHAGGGVVKEFENRDVREINRSRAGSKHDGGFARGGHADKAEDERLIRAEVKPSALRDRRGRYSGGPVDVPAVKRAMKSAQRVGVDPQNSHDTQRRMYEKAAADKARRLADKEARAGHADGGEVIEKPTYWQAVKDRVKDLVGIKSPVATGNPSAPYEGVGGKSREDAIMGAVNDAETGRKRGGKAVAKLTGVDFAGGREARARGGRAKGKTNINIIIGAQKPTPVPVPVPGGAPGAPPLPPGGAGMHQGAPPMMPPGGLPPGAPPMAPPPMGRRAGGRVAHGLGFDRKTAEGPGSTAPAMTHAAGGGLGRLQKVKTYGGNAKVA